MDRSKLTTERRNPHTRNLDTRSTLQIVEIINSQDAMIAGAVARQKRAIAAAVDAIVSAFTRGGRLFYVGAGTSGRLGVLDASECPPTFGVPRTMVQGIIAGGRRALVRSSEGAEDDSKAGAAAIDHRRINGDDVVVGIAACGVTPFVRGAIERASRRGAATVFVSCAPQARGIIAADTLINPVVGPEVVAGSTRMKAGTATKLVLNTLTTAAMIRLGKVHDNLMVDMRATNAKLRDRAGRIIALLTGLPPGQALSLLDRADGLVKPAVVMHHRRLALRQAARLLRQCGGSLRKALEAKDIHRRGADDAPAPKHAGRPRRKAMEGRKCPKQ